MSLDGVPLGIADIVSIHEAIVASSGGATGLRDPAALEACVAAPWRTFDGEYLYPDLPARACVLGFEIVSQHPFLDANKRTGHAAMEVMLALSGWEIELPIDDGERLMIELASGSLGRSDFEQSVRAVLVRLR